MRSLRAGVSKISGGLYIWRLEMGPEYKCREGKRNVRREIGRDGEKSRGGGRRE